MIIQRYYTDYPILFLGDISGKTAPIREVIPVSYDGDKYVYVRLPISSPDNIVEIKRAYIYTKPGRCGTVPTINRKELNKLPHTEYKHG